MNALTLIEKTSAGVAIVTKVGPRSFEGARSWDRAAITPAHEADGKWRVAGCFIKPAP